MHGQPHIQMFVPWARDVHEYVNFKILLLSIIIIIDIIAYYFLQVILFVQPVT